MAESSVVSSGVFASGKKVGRPKEKRPLMSELAQRVLENERRRAVKKFGRVGEILVNHMLKHPEKRRNGFTGKLA